VGESAHEYEHTVKSQGDQEQVKISIISLADAISDPGAVVVEPLYTVITNAAVRGSRRPENLASEAVLELDCLSLDLNLLGAGRGPVRGARTVVWLLNLSLDTVSFSLGRSGNNARVCEAGFEEI